MKNKYYLFVIFIIVSLVLPFTFFAYADEPEEVSSEITSEESSSEPSSEEESTTVVVSSECSHNWEVVAFDSLYNVITLKCSECDLIHTLDFAECLTNFNSNNQYFHAVDVNNDGVINGRDYSYLVRGFTNLLQTDSFINMFSSKEFLYKEMFLYIYLTVLFIVSTGFICVSVRRSNK